MNPVIISNKIATLDSYNALSALECCLLNLDTPLIESYGLEEYKNVGGKMIETYRESLISEIKDQMRALNKARIESGEKVLGTHLIGGVTVPKIEQVEPTLELIKSHRTLNINW